VNLLVATSVAEEGLDLAGCNLVVRFDLPISAIAMVQSRGRLKHTNGKFVILANESECKTFEELKERERLTEQAILYFTRKILPTWDSGTKTPLSGLSEQIAKCNATGIKEKLVDDWQSFPSVSLQITYGEKTWTGDGTKNEAKHSAAAQALEAWGVLSAYQAAPLNLKKDSDLEMEINEDEKSEEEPEEEEEEEEEEEALKRKGSVVSQNMNEKGRRWYY